jgi:alpha-beta hydrolase superfamily lysophospholipase
MDYSSFDNPLISEGRALYDNCPSSSKKMLMISGANHNTIFECGLHDYMNAIKEFIEA